MKPRSRTSLRCQAALPARGGPCRRDAIPGHLYCPTHQFLLDPGGNGIVSLSMVEELSLARLQIHKLIGAGAPPERVLNAMRTLALIARLQERVQRATRP